MIKDVIDLASKDFSGGLNTVSDFFKLEKEQTPNCMNVKFNFDGDVHKRLGTHTLNTVALSATGSAGTLGITTCGWAMFDFGTRSGTTDIRWLTVAAGTAVWASSGMGQDFVRIASDRVASYQYLDRSRNVLVLTSDSYQNVLYWAGSPGTMAALLNVSAPLAKYSINFKSFLILLNSSTRKKGFYYEDEVTQIIGDWGSVDPIGAPFDIPSSDDDEITGAFILSNKLFISTRYKIYGISYVGGNPDWDIRLLASWGYVPRTVDKITVGDSEVAIGLDWNRRIRVFDGYDNSIISDNVENDNGMCDFATSKISYTGSGLLTSFGRTDDNEQVYKLGVAIGATTQKVTHFLCFDGRTKSFYPYDYTTNSFMSMCMAESGNRRYLVACDQSGWVHLLDSGNLDRNTYTINDVLDSNFKFDRSPSETAKISKIDLFFSVNSCGQVYYQDRIDFASTFTTRKIINVSSDSRLIEHYESIDIPSTQNIYQYRITSSSSTTTPWELHRADFFIKPLGIGREQQR